MSENINFYNYGYIMADLPDELYQDLKKECLEVESKGIPYETGMSNDYGCPKHYKVTESKQALQTYVKQLAESSYKWYQPMTTFAKSISHLDGETQLVAHDPWINYQKKHDVLPNHIHAGFLSYSIYVSVPALAEINLFQFIYNTAIGTTSNHDIVINKHMEGKIIMFPSLIQHVAYPFYTSDETKISVSGNLSLQKG